MLNKKGQFFLMAVFVIIGMLISLRTVYNVAQTSEEDLIIETLPSEIKIESSQIIDNGYFTNTQEKIPARVSDLFDVYSRENPSSDIIVIHGTESKFSVYYQDASKEDDLIFKDTTTLSENNEGQSGGSVSLGSAGLDLNREKIIKKSFRAEDGAETLNLVINGNINKEFPINRGENLYLIVKKNKGNDVFIETKNE